MRIHYTILMTFTILLAYSQFKAKLYHVHPHEHNMLGHCEKTDGNLSCFSNVKIDMEVLDLRPLGYQRAQVDEIALLVHTV
jgi:hypothetical protein